MEQLTQTDPQRPRFHFTAESQWINDPNGLVYLDGEYHLFCQLNPFGSSWGSMTWGHAVSENLLDWHHLAPAIEPYPARVPHAQTMIFSGSAIRDRLGISGATDGLGLLAYYTAHERRDEASLCESIALAVSTDRGRTWTRHDGNPILDTQRTDFRDPKVLWHAATEAFVMAVADPPGLAIEFYRSTDGLRWDLSGRFSAPAFTDKIWECPDLIELHIDDDDDGTTAWTLFVSAGHFRGAAVYGNAVLGRGLRRVHLLGPLAGRGCRLRTRLLRGDHLQRPA